MEAIGTSKLYPTPTLVWNGRLWNEQERMNFCVNYNFPRVQEINVETKTRTTLDPPRQVAGVLQQLGDGKVTIKGPIRNVCFHFPQAIGQVG